MKARSLLLVFVLGAIAAEAAGSAVSVDAASVIRLELQIEADDESESSDNLTMRVTLHNRSGSAISATQPQPG